MSVKVTHTFIADGLSRGCMANAVVADNCREAAVRVDCYPSASAGIGKFSSGDCKKLAEFFTQLAAFMDA